MTELKTIQQKVEEISRQSREDSMLRLTTSSTHRKEHSHEGHQGNTEVGSHRQGRKRRLHRIRFAVRRRMADGGDRNSDHVAGRSKA